MNEPPIAALPARWRLRPSTSWVRRRPFVRVLLWAVIFVATLTGTLSAGASIWLVGVAVWLALAIASGLSVALGVALDRRSRREDRGASGRR